MYMLQLLRLGEPMVSCECKIFSTLQPTTFPDHVNYIGSTPIPTCCHCRLMKDLLKICPFEDMIDLSNTPDYINVQVSSSFLKTFMQECFPRRPSGCEKHLILN